jgi:glutamate dehydrogenase
MSARTGEQRTSNPLLSTLLRAWRRSMPSEEFRQISIAARAHALDQLAYGRQRRNGQTLLRITSPPAATTARTLYSVLEVITDDMPFLVDTLLMNLATAGIGVRLIVHPIINARRNGSGRLLGFGPAGSAARVTPESWQQLWIDRIADEGERRQLEGELARALDGVRRACTDWAQMRATVGQLLERMEQQPPPLPLPVVRESAELLRYMADNHFTFLGYLESKLRRGKGGPRLEPVPGSGLGLLRDGKAPRGGQRASVPSDNIRRALHSRDLLVLTKANVRSTIHRTGYLDYVGLKLFDRRGKLSGEARIIGLWTTSAYRADPRTVPLIRQKVQRVIDHFPFSPTSHDGKRLVQILDSLPRDELFQASYRDLVRCARTVLVLQERQQVRLVLRRDEFRRFWSCLVFLPRDRCDAEARRRIEALLQRELGGGQLDSSLTVTDSPLAQLHVVVRCDEHFSPAIQHARLEREISEALVTWRDRLRQALHLAHEEQRAAALERYYAEAFPDAYRQEVMATLAVQDIADLEALGKAEGTTWLRLYRPAAQPGERVHLRIMRRVDALPVSEVLPILENFGLRIIGEHPYELRWPGAASAWIQDFELEQQERQVIDVAALAPQLTAAFAAVRAGELDNDGFNRLLISAGLQVREANVLRVYCRYLLQTGIPFSLAYMARTLNQHGSITRELWRLFDRCLSPAATDAGAARAAARCEERILKAIGAVRSPDEDRILRAFLALIRATLRTNYYRDDAVAAGRCLALKLDPRLIPRLPEPRPAFEIFVHSPRIEGVHMRRGPIARGGIRWSERAEDFRTEVLGLMKAQHVKNTLIVPVGAKGGFVARRLRSNATPDERAREVRECYQSYIRALLDVTDNIVEGQVVAPPGVRRRDGDDPYLVVAADKGTASFSDFANAIAAEYHFWLGDAFASGGSAGYDHKKMGITARGGWECVKRHFRELGHDIQRRAFSVAGIGDMSGDVFGNAMLLSPEIRLVAAFNHAHIFIDPNPDAAKSFRERERLFALPRSGWSDYDPRLLSRGGAVFDRTRKSLTLSAEARTLLGLEQSVATPEQVVRAILCLNVDLLWNGGIGTYVKAIEERNGEIGDRANDAVRIDGHELRARVVGEGGNLGLSQRGRIEYARGGGRINTDFVDNSAGVNTSDEEVNIKIMLASPGGSRLSGEPRRKLLASVTDEIATHVLRNNYLQSQALSLLERRAVHELPEQMQLMRSLQLHAELDREIEFLPSDAQIEERQARGQGLTRPELAVLLAYGKIGLNHALIEADIAADPYLSNELMRYFPERFRKRFAVAIKHHRLRSELIATTIANSILNRMDPGFPLRIATQTGAGTASMARAYTISRDSAGLRGLWTAIEGLDNRVAAEHQYEALLASRDYLEYLTRRLLAPDAPEIADIGAAVARLEPVFRELAAALPACLSGLERERYSTLRAHYQQAGLPVALASHLAALPALRVAPDLAALAERGRRSLAEVARSYFELGTALGADWLHQAIEQLRTSGPWQVVARERLFAASRATHQRLCAKLLEQRVVRTGNLTDWIGRRGTAGAQWQQTLRELRALPSADLAALMAGVEALKLLV